VVPAWRDPVSWQVTVTGWAGRLPWRGGWWIMTAWEGLSPLAGAEYARAGLAG
jgi:hypothetical protein